MVFGYFWLNCFLADSCFRVKDLGLDFAAGVVLGIAEVIHLVACLSEGGHHFGLIFLQLEAT